MTMKALCPDNSIGSELQGFTGQTLLLVSCAAISLLWATAGSIQTVRLATWSSAQSNRAPGFTSLQRPTPTTQWSGHDDPRMRLLSPHVATVPSPCPGASPAVDLETSRASPKVRKARPQPTHWQCSSPLSTATAILNHNICVKYP